MSFDSLPFLAFLALVVVAYWLLPQRFRWVLLLIVSYLYGTWRLRSLGGPSVEEFKSGAEPPWEGQQRGF